MVIDFRNLLTVMILIVASVVPVGFAEASSSWPNEPVGSTAMTDFPLDAKQGNGWLAVYPAGGNIVSDSSAPGSPPNVLQYGRSSGTVGNASNTYYDFSPKNELYFGFWWKPSSPFTGWSTNQNKFAIVKNQPSAHFYLLMVGQQGGPFQFAVQLDYFTGNAHLGSGYGDNPGPWNLFANRGNPTVKLGAWHRVEMYIKNSSSPTSRNGIMRWWMDGVLLGDYNQVNYPGPFWEFMLAPVWDMGIALPSPEYHSYDHVHISQPNGGPNASDQPPGPPAAPRILNVTAQ